MIVSSTSEPSESSVYVLMRSEFQQKNLSGSFSNRKVKGNADVRWCSNGKKICEGLLAHVLCPFCILMKSWIFCVFPVLLSLDLGDSGPEVERRRRLVGRLWVRGLIVDEGEGMLTWN
ncbi:hypothetical protein Ancab_031417 [Ancistrocladus abbreviatus]